MVSSVIGCAVFTLRRPNFSCRTGLPCCWISRMAPGILPAATSPRRNALTRVSPAGERLRGAGDGVSARTGQAAPTSRTKAAARTVRTRTSVLHCLIDQLLQRPLHALALAWCLFQQDEEHVLLGIDHKIAAGSAVPFQFADIAGRRRLGVARIGA